MKYTLFRSVNEDLDPAPLEQSEGPFPEPLSEPFPDPPVYERSENFDIPQLVRIESDYMFDFDITYYKIEQKKGILKHMFYIVCLKRAFSALK